MQSQKADWWKSTCSVRCGIEIIIQISGYESEMQIVVNKKSFVLIMITVKKKSFILIMNKKYRYKSRH